MEGITQSFRRGSQNNQLVRFIFHESKAVSRLNAFTELGIQNLTARITELRDAGYPIRTLIEEDMAGRPITFYFDGR